jgi:hypothetical protein
MKRTLTLLLLFVLCAASAYASVIPAKLTEQKCGNGVREGYELCEPDTAYDLCPSIGKFLKVAMVCDERNCACLPGESAKDCGNGIREGVEMCESDKKGSAFDLCPNMSQIIGVPLKCELSSCDCVNDGLAIKISHCGDKNVEGYEDCEADDDCPKGRTCDNCTCVRNDVPLNLTPVEHNVTGDDVPVLTVEEIIRKQKQTVLNFVLDDYVGEVLPEALDYFDDETINVQVALKDGANITVSIVTTEMVVQEVHNYALNDSTMNLWMDEEAVAAIKASDKRTETIVSFLETGKIGYTPTGFFRRIWFLFFTPF